MDLAQRMEAERKAIRECWEGLAAELLDTVDRWNKNCTRGTDDGGNVFWVNGPQQAKTRGRQRILVTASLHCLFNQDLGSVTVKTFTRSYEAPKGYDSEEAPDENPYRIVANTEGGASLEGTDGKRVSAKDAAYAILKPFLVRFK